MFDAANAPTFLCAGDDLTTNEGVFTIRARIEFDHNSSPEDADCYTPEMVEAWKADEWFFAGIVLNVSVNGIDLGVNTSLWGVEINLENDNSHALIVANEMIGEAVEEAKAQLARLADIASAVAA